MGDGLAKLSGGKLEKILERLTSNIFMQVLLGAAVTAVIQSSSATTVMVVGFVNSGIMKLKQAVGVIMGANIGTCVTALISGIGAGKNAKRASLIHLYFNLIGTTVFMIAFYSINGILTVITGDGFGFLDSSINATWIAVIHSAFNPCNQCS